MASIALIGPDGAGKTTVCRMLEADSGLPLKYMYMGVNAESSNIALPTTRLVRLLKRRAASGNARDSGPEISSPARPGRFRAIARLVNHLADEWYRQLISWGHQTRGYIVLCDRHYVFDFSRHLRINGYDRLSSRIHRFLLEKIYPRPDLVIYLDAPAEVLFARKREGTLESLETRRQAFLCQGAELPNFVRIDASRPLAAVYGDAVELIRGAAQDRRTKRGGPWGWVDRQC